MGMISFPLCKECFSRFDMIAKIVNTSPRDETGKSGGIMWDVGLQTGVVYARFFPNDKYKKLQKFLEEL